MTLQITVEQTEPNMLHSRRHFCLASRKFIGLAVGSTPPNLVEIYCPWCGVAVPPERPARRYDAAVKAEKYAGPLCRHGYPDVTCSDLSDGDPHSKYQLVCRIAIREFGAAELARRYGIAPAVSDWIRPCPDCRSENARLHQAILRYELEQIAAALARETKSAERHLESLRDDLHRLHEAFAEFEEALKDSFDDPGGKGFVYLIGHRHAFKIGWSEKHPARSRLAQLQTSSSERLEILGLIEGTRSSERDLHRRFSAHRLMGEWFARHEDISTYFRENGIAV